MITTCGMMVAALATASGLLFFRQELDEDLFAFGCMACIGFYLIAFSSGAGAIPWFLAGELVPVEVKPATQNIAHSTLLQFLIFPNSFAAWCQDCRSPWPAFPSLPPSSPTATLSTPSLLAGLSWSTLGAIFFCSFWSPHFFQRQKASPRCRFVSSSVAHRKAIKKIPKKASIIHENEELRE